MNIVDVLSLFGRSSGPFPVPVETTLAVARRRGQGRPSGRRGTRLALDHGEHGRTLSKTVTIGGPRAMRASFLVVGVCVGLAWARPSLAEPAQIDAAQREQIIAAAIDEAALRFNLPRRWISLVLAQESGGQVAAVSPKGAMGLMQLMPATWRDLSDELDLGDDPFDPRDNILAGTAYMRRMYDLFGAPGFLAAYNAGPARFERYLRGEASLPVETRDYVERLGSMLGEKRGDRAPIAVSDWRASMLFVAPGKALADTADRP